MRNGDEELRFPVVNRFFLAGCFFTRFIIDAMFGEILYFLVGGIAFLVQHGIAVVIFLLSRKRAFPANTSDIQCRFTVNGVVHDSGFHVSAVDTVASREVGEVANLVIRQGSFAQEVEPALQFVSFFLVFDF